LIMQTKHGSGNTKAGEGDGEDLKCKGKRGGGRRWSIFMWGKKRMITRRGLWKKKRFCTETMIRRGKRLQKTTTKKKSKTSGPTTNKKGETLAKGKGVGEKKEQDLRGGMSRGNQMILIRKKTREVSSKKRGG